MRVTLLEIVLIAAGLGTIYIAFNSNPRNDLLILVGFALIAAGGWHGTKEPSPPQWPR
ncbi:hypothetical protein HYS54_03040 [Candidatus Micrarchaeota archaeon]|nr:hypothetical protein [Candidatus Micrarchaeota archaeon]